MIHVVSFLGGRWVNFLAWITFMMPLPSASVLSSTSMSMRLHACKKCVTPAFTQYWGLIGATITAIALRTVFMLLMKCGAICPTTFNIYIINSVTVTRNWLLYSCVRQGTSWQHLALFTWNRILQKLQNQQLTTVCLSVCLYSHCPLN